MCACACVYELQHNLPSEFCTSYLINRLNLSKTSEILEMINRIFGRDKRSLKNNNEVDDAIVVKIDII